MLRYSSLTAEHLIRACAESNDRAAWGEFVSRYQRAISLSIIRVANQWGQAPGFVVGDLVQETYLKLCTDQCRRLLAFAVQNPEAVLGYIQTIAVNVAHDHFKALFSQKRGSAQTAQLEEDLDPQAQSGGMGGQAAMEREVLLKQIDRCLETCTEGPEQERDRLIFWLYYQQGMSANAIAALPTVGLTPKGVESLIFRLTRLVREQIVGLRSQSPASPQPPEEKGFRPAESY